MAIPVSDTVPLTGEALKDGLLQGSSWTFAGPRVLTYSFNTNFDFDTYGNVIPGPGGTWASYPALATAFARALGAWSNVANIGFQNVPSGNYFFESTADMAVGLTGDDLYKGLGAVALGFFPDPRYATLVLTSGGYTRENYPRPEGDLLLDNYHPIYSYLADAGVGYATLVHEIGHVLGLKHPFDDGGNSRPTFGSLGIAQYDQERYTVMSYHGSDLQASGNAATPMPLDILAIQQIYGANMGFHAGNDDYVPVIDGAMRTIWDAAGTDMLDASSFANGVTLDLRPGALMDLGSGTVLGIAYNCIIENATGGAGSDTLQGNEANNILRGQGGSNTLFGDGGNDSLEGGSGSNTLDGGSGNDTLVGGSGNESLIGGSGNDVLTGGAGTNNYDGGPGDDTFYISSPSDRVRESFGEGSDTVLASASFNGSGTESIEYITLTGTADIDARAGTGTIRVNGNSGANVLGSAQGIATPMTLAGGPGNDTYLVRGWDVTILENAGEGIDEVVLTFLRDYQLTANVERLTLDSPIIGITATALTGNGLDNLITGAVGPNLIDGGTGADTMIGGGGADTFVVDSPGDSVVESLDSSVDTVQSAISYTLGATLENLTLTGAGAINGSGNGLANVINGNDAANRLSGAGGNDALVGAGGNDTLDGGIGFDALRGGSGNDTYIVDTVVPATGLGMLFDDGANGARIYQDASSATFTPYLFDYTGDGLVDYLSVQVTDQTSGESVILNFSTVALGQNLQVGTYANAEPKANPQPGHAGIFIGSDAYHSTGTSASFTIERAQFDYSAAAPTLVSFGATFDLPGSWSLRGAFSINYQTGFTEPVSENPGQGTDTVVASVDYRLGDNVEKLTLSGADALTGRGNALDNVIAGNGGNNTLAGAGGNDLFIFAATGNGLDRITDFGPGDAIAIGAAAFYGTTGSGDGTQLAANQVQLGYDAIGALLYVGTDGAAGADVTIRINGAPSGSAFKLLGNQIGFEVNNHAPSGSVTLSGSGSVDQPLTVGNSLDDLDGLGPVSYQWLVDARAILGATGPSYTPGQAQAGHAISAQASYLDGHGVAESVFSAPLLVPFEPRAVEVLAYSWNAHTLLGGVGIRADGLDGATEATDSNGSLRGIADVPTLGLGAERALPPGEAAATIAAVNVQDAIDILKMIVGLDVNGANRPLSPYQSLAADFDGNGAVNVGDAVQVLRHVVGLTAPDPAWHFLNEADPAVPAKTGLTPGTRQINISADISGNSPVHVGLAGYLSGDVNGSYAGAAGALDLDNTQPDYFQSLSASTGLSLSQFGVYP